MSGDDFYWWSLQAPPREMPDDILKHQIRTKLEELESQARVELAEEIWNIFESDLPLQSDCDEEDPAKLIDAVFDTIWDAIQYLEGGPESLGTLSSYYDEKGNPVRIWLAANDSSAYFALNHLNLTIAEYTGDLW